MFEGRGKHVKQREKALKDKVILIEMWEKVLVPQFLAAVGFRKTLQGNKIGHFIGGLFIYESFCSSACV